MNEPTTYQGADVSALLAITTLSGLVEAIIDAGERLDRELFVPASGSWFSPRTWVYNREGRDRNRCQVCDAGAVLAACGMTYRTNFVFPKAYVPGEQELHYRLSALDYLRSGMWSSAASSMDIVLTIPQRAVLNDLDKPEWSSFGRHHDTTCWEDFDAHVTDLRDRVLPVLEHLAL